MSRPKTQNAGADLERQAIRGKVRRMLNQDWLSGWDSLLTLAIWIDKRAERNAAKPGGLGKPKPTPARLANGMSLHGSMKRKALVIIAGLMLASTAHVDAQPLPDRFAAAGLGFQSAAVPQTSGWVTVCAKTTERVYTCGATDYAGSTSSARAEVDTLLATSGPLQVFGKAGAGAATSASGVGGSFAAGGVAVLDIGKWVKLLGPGLHAVASITWVKNDVSEQVSPAGPVAFGQKAVFRFGFGRAW